MLAVLLSQPPDPSIAAEPKPQEVVVAMPSFAPRASAALIVCAASSSVVLAGKNEGAHGNPLRGAAIVASAYGESEKASRGYIRLHFTADNLKVSGGYYDGETRVWGPDYDYTVQSDAPEDFVATRKGSGEQAMPQTLVLNRVTGTAILTLAVASLPSGAHPQVTSTFYVCEPAR